MKSVICVWKEVGLTPLDSVNKFKEQNPEYVNETISYAGRLDPMAEGILLLLVGEENKKRNKYLNLKKTYKSEIIFGIFTDSFDGLGLIEGSSLNILNLKEVENALGKFVGKQRQIYPPFSSKAVKGKPLYWWARNKKLEEIDLPSREIEIYSVSLKEDKKIFGEIIASKIIENVKKVDGDFRQDEIINGWEKFAIENNSKEFLKIKIKVKCSSGTYVRRIASDLGLALGVGAFAYSIKRTEIGDFIEKDCLRI